MATPIELDAVLMTYGPTKNDGIRLSIVSDQADDKQARDRIKTEGFIGAQCRVVLFWLDDDGNPMT